MRIASLILTVFTAVTPASAGAASPKLPPVPLYHWGLRERDALATLPERQRYIIQDPAFWMAMLLKSGHAEGEPPPHSSFLGYCRDVAADPAKSAALDLTPEDCDIMQPFGEAFMPGDK